MLRRFWDISRDLPNVWGVVDAFRQPLNKVYRDTRNVEGLAPYNGTVVPAYL